MNEDQDQEMLMGFLNVNSGALAQFHFLGRGRGSGGSVGGHNLLLLGVAAVADDETSNHSDNSDTGDDTSDDGDHAGSARGSGSVGNRGRSGGRSN